MSGQMKNNKIVIELHKSEVCVNDTGRWYGDLAIFFAQCATEFTMSYSDISENFYDALGYAYMMISTGRRHRYLIRTMKATLRQSVCYIRRSKKKQYI